MFYVHPYFKGKIPILASIFFRWVETSSGAISGRIVGEVVSFLDLKLAHPGAESFHQKKQIQSKLQTSPYSSPLKNDGWKTTVTISFWYGRCSGSILNFQGVVIQLFLLKIVKGLVKSYVSSSMSKLCMESRP